MAIIDDVDQSHVYSDSAIFSQMTMKDVNVFIFFASSFTSGFCASVSDAVFEKLLANPISLLFSKSKVESLEKGLKIH